MTRVSQRKLSSTFRPLSNLLCSACSALLCLSPYWLLCHQLQLDQPACTCSNPISVNYHLLFIPSKGGVHWLCFQQRNYHQKMIIPSYGMCDVHWLCCQQRNYHQIIASWADEEMLTNLCFRRSAVFPFIARSTVAFPEAPSV